MVLETFGKKAVSVLQAPSKLPIHLAVALDAEFLKTACATHVRSIAFVPFLVLHPDSDESTVEECAALCEGLPILQPKILSLPASYVLQQSDQIPAGHIIHDVTFQKRYSAKFPLLDRIDPYLVPNPIRHGPLVDCCLHALPVAEDSPTAMATTAAQGQSKRKEYSTWDPVMPFPSQGPGALKGVEKLFVNEAISILEETTKEQSLGLPGTMNISMFGRGSKKGRKTFAQFLRLYGLDAYKVQSSGTKEELLKDAVIRPGHVNATGTIDRDTVRSFLRDCFHDSSEHLHQVDQRLPVDAHYMPRIVIDRPGDPTVSSGTLRPTVDFLPDFPAFSSAMHSLIAEYQDFTAKSDMSLGIYGYGNADNLVIQNSLEYPHDKRSKGGAAFAQSDAKKMAAEAHSGLADGGSVVHDWTSNRAFLDFCKFDLEVHQTPGLVKSINGAAALGEPCKSFIARSRGGAEDENAKEQESDAQVEKPKTGHDNHNPMWDAAALAMLIAQFGC